MTTALTGAFQTIVYYVVPLAPAGAAAAATQQCAYYQVGPAGWNPVSCEDLPTGFGSDYVCIEQPRAQDVPAGVLPAGRRYDSGATLFAAVAKTLQASQGLPNTFLASVFHGRPRVVLPVAPATSRGVILLFSQGQGNAVTALLASDDPVIKGSGS